MITTPAGAHSARFNKHQTWKRKIRIEKVARLSKDAIFSNEQIANHLGVHVQTIISIKATAEYQAKMMELVTGVMQTLDTDLETMKQQSMEELAAMLPTALFQLRSCLLSNNPNIKMKAIETVLDREGTLAKISKSTVKHEVGVDLAKTNATAIDIMALLGRPVGQEITEIDIAGGFTINAAAATAQVKNMSEAIDEKTLEALDLSNLKKQ